MTLDPYERGKMDGQINERLAAHDRHFASINGQLERVAASLLTITASLARVADRQQNIVDVTQATQVALQTASEQRWSRWQKLFAVLGAVGALVGLYFAWRTGGK